MDNIVIPPLALMAAEDVQRRGGSMYEVLVAALSAWPEMYTVPLYRTPTDIVLPVNREASNG